MIDMCEAPPFRKAYSKDFLVEAFRPFLRQNEIINESTGNYMGQTYVDKQTEISWIKKKSAHQVEVEKQ